MKIKLAAQTRAERILERWLATIPRNSRVTCHADPSALILHWQFEGQTPSGTVRFFVGHDKMHVRPRTAEMLARLFP